jgi:predicted amidohydrolase YtcJ
MSDLLFRNGTVFDGSAFLPSGTGVRVRAETIVEIGADLAVNGAEVVDLDGGTLLPGFIDAHVHPVFAGNQLRHCDLRAGITSADYAAIVAAYAESHPDETWITGGGWSMDALPGGLPTRDVIARRSYPIWTDTAPGSTAWR